MTGFTEATFRVLGELAANNNKEWYDANKDRLKKDARDPFEAMLGIVTVLLEGSQYPVQGNAKTMFRQNRDVRFSKDKTPYKTTVSGMLTPSGIKDESNGVVYAQVGPDGGLIAAGHYRLATADLNLVRDHILANPDHFTQIRADLRHKGWELRTENRLSGMARGYSDHVDHPLVDALRLKTYTVLANQRQQVWINGDIVENLVALAEDIGPLLAFIRDGLSRAPK